MKFRRKRQYVNAVMFRGPIDHASVSEPIKSEEQLKATKCFKEYPDWLVKLFLDGTIKFRYREVGGHYLKTQYMGEMIADTAFSGDYLVLNPRGKVEIWTKWAFEEMYERVYKTRKPLERSK
jgi:hypothetical protein